MSLPLITVVVGVVAVAVTCWCELAVLLITVDRCYAFFVEW